jgi:hypothetical protein
MPDWCAAVGQLAVSAPPTTPSIASIILAGPATTTEARRASLAQLVILAPFSLIVCRSSPIPQFHARPLEIPPGVEMTPFQSKAI